MEHDSAKNDRFRSRYMRRLILEAEPTHTLSVGSPLPRVPKALIQFWHDPVDVPADVRECLDSWRPLEHQGFERLLFDDREAGRFIADQLGPYYSAAFAKCRHPAMRYDYFRLCFIARHGGFYVDADEWYQGADCDFLFRDRRLKLQPLCYDVSAETMVRTDSFIDGQNDSPDWIFYVNNNPIIAPPFHPVIQLALARCTRTLLNLAPGRVDIQSTTGPGNLTASLVQHAIASDAAGAVRDFAIMPGWDAISVSRWPLSYRGDERNWRLWSRGNHER